MNSNKTNQPEVLLLGGEANSLSAARSLGSMGITVNIAAPSISCAAKSKYIKHHYIQPADTSRADFYHDLLLNQEVIPTGTVVFACGDHSISMVARHKHELRQKYILDLQPPETQLDLLNKQKTLDLARQAGCPAPGYWSICNIEDVRNAIPDMMFPVLLKPIYSHLFQQQFNNRKLFIAYDEKMLIKLSNKVLDAGLEFMLCEFIPGPDNLLNSYYCYIDDSGNTLFEFTKEIERRSPVNFGAGCYHRTRWRPVTADMGRRFFNGIEFNGLGNIEFKLDTRDNQLKVIECNARFTSAQQLITDSGIDMPYLIYQYLAHGIEPGQTSFRDGVTMLLPFEDFDTFRDLRRENQLTFNQWLRSIARPHSFSYYRLSDPAPFIKALSKTLKSRIKGKLKWNSKH